MPSDSLPSQRSTERSPPAVTEIKDHYMTANSTKIPSLLEGWNRAIPCGGTTDRTNGA